MKVKIHCFEGEWDDEHQDLSVRPLMHVLEQSYKAAGVAFAYTYKFCQTTARLKDNLRLSGRKFSNTKYRNCLYFAFHGTSQGLFSADPDECVSFSEIAELLGKKTVGSILFFGSCGAKKSIS